MSTKEVVMTEEWNESDDFERVGTEGLSGEDKQYIKELDKVIIDKIINVFNRLELWFFDAAMCDFTVEEQIKVLLLSEKYVSDKTYHLSLEALMRSLYLDYKNKKEVNLYKKRIIENYLKEI